MYLVLQNQSFSLVPIDKAANNVSFVCNRYYVPVLVKELGMNTLGLLPMNTYKIPHLKK